MRTSVGLGIAVLFSLLYVSLYPMLTGNFVIYWYPAWPTPLAAAYVAGGILVQAWFCFRRGTRVTGRSLVAQVLAGIGYLMVSMVVSGGPYQS